MKGIFKLFPVAVAMVALVSCSDDLYNGSNDSKFAGKPTLDVTIEQLNDGVISTRAANVGEGNSVLWQAGDKISVYDDMMFIYDPYTFDATAKSFVLETGEKELLETPQFALFPQDYFGEGSTSWERKTDRVFVLADIPAEMTYGNGKPTPYDVTSDGKAAYVSLLPMWGTASKADGKTSVSLKYMTAILKVTLTNAMGNVKYLYIRGKKDLAGTQYAQLNGAFKAYLSESGRIPATSAILEPANTTPGAADSYIEVDISNISKATSVIYVPIPAGHYGILDVWAETARDANPATHAVTTAEKIYQFVDKTFEVKFYGSLTKKEYDVDGTTVEKLNALLTANASEASDELVIDCADKGATRATSSTDEVIRIPAMAAANVELKLADIYGAPATIAGDSFTGKLILNLTNATATTGLTINLPNADVVLKGSSTGARTIAINNAKSVTFGDATAPVAPATLTTDYSAATINVLAEVLGDVKVAKYAKVDALTLPDNHRTANLVVEGESGDLTVNASATVSATAVTVSGTSGRIQLLTMLLLSLFLAQPIS